VEATIAKELKAAKNITAQEIKRLAKKGLTLR
jgi:Mn-dependent DtxR family transcriptional regulator